MTDFHSHILPGIDDGSASVSESIKMLEELAAQGVRFSVATPHYSADRESPDEFIARRRAAYECLASELPDGLPEIICGAEVRYYPGISRMADLHKLCIEGSRLFLLEMSASRWTEYTVKELLELAGRGRLTVVLAHMERYMRFQSRKTIEMLYQSGILMQFNASFFLEFGTGRKAINMMRNGEIHLIGSDCHNLTSRAPRIGDAFALIKSKLGESFVARFNEYGYSLLDLH